MNSRKSCLILGMFLTLALAGCTGAPRGEGSLLLISIPNFRADSLECSPERESPMPQVDSICEESVRFTHVYTPSLLQNAALGSVLTGLYPSEHGIHTNGASSFADGVKPISQAAKDRGLSTIFVSGGVPALRKAGISRGFDEFDDSVRVNGSFYRPADELVSKFLSLMELREGMKFLAVLQFADLLFPEIVSVRHSQSDKKEGTYIGKLQEIDEAIGALKAQLKKAGLWDQTTVVIFGLQGVEKGEEEDFSHGMSFSDAVVRVPVLIKPGHKPRDKGLSWKVDQPVSLVDLGVTLFNFLGVPNPNKSHFPLRDIMQRTQDVGPDRAFFCETDLPAWRNWGPRLYSIRLGEWVYWPLPEPQLFNTYTDRLELHNLYAKDYTVFSRLEKVWNEFKPFLTSGENKNAKFLPSSIIEKLRVGKAIFSRDLNPAEKERRLTELHLRRPDDWQVLQWLLSFYFENQNIVSLRQVLPTAKPILPEQKKEYLTWMNFAGLKLRVSGQEFVQGSAFPCLELATNLRRLGGKEFEDVLSKKLCDDPETFFWLKAYASYRLKKFKDASTVFEVAKGLTEKRSEQADFAKAFWLDGAVWDYNQNLPGGPAFFDLFTALNTDQSFARFIKKKQVP